MPSTDAPPSSLQQHPEPQQPVPDSLAGGALGVDSDDDARLCECLFRGLVFFLGREVPQEPLLFVIRAFGGTVAWDGESSPLKEADESITHQVGGVGGLRCGGGLKGRTEAVCCSRGLRVSYAPDGAQPEPV